MHGFGRRMSWKKAVSTLVVVMMVFVIWRHGWGRFAAMGNGMFNKFEAVSLRRGDMAVREQLHFSRYTMSDYGNFTREVGGRDGLGKLSLSDRCERFFEYHERAHPEWQFGVVWGETQHDKSVVSKKRYFEKREKEIIKENKSKKVPNAEVISRADRAKINKEFEKKVKETCRTEERMADSISIMRLYGQCFLNHENSKMDKTFQTYSKKLFPYLSGKLPVYERFDGSVITNGIPVFDKNGYAEKTKKYNGDNVIQFMKDNTNGRGIVISVARAYTKELVSLIRVFRALNNKLPIQIVFKQREFGRRGRDALLEAARSEPSEVLQIIKDSDTSGTLNQEILNQFEEFGSTFPKQELWFVNLDSVMSKSDISRFASYKNKILAYFFNSFEEVLLLDSDSVPLIPLEKFFETNEYKETGTLLFKDRSLGDTNDYIETNFFTKLFPVNRKSLDGLFDIPLTTSKTLTNKYMTGWRHFQEAGVVVIDRKKHLLGMLMTLPLAIWRSPVDSSIWGDKEMYWLGLAMAGDENYAFNKHSAASVGVTTKKKEHKLYTDERTHEVCSNHPGHINADGKLLWVNSGFTFCKKNGFGRDKNKFPFSLMTFPEVRDIYQEPFSIRDAIAPPDLPNYREPGSPVDDTMEIEFKNGWKKRKPDIDEINNQDVREFHKLDLENPKHYDQITEYLPQQGWIKSGICTGYMYCAYNTIGSYTNDGEYINGHIFDLSSQQKLYDYLGQIWMSGKLKIK